MARIGKIARLPRLIRDQLNTRLQDGLEGQPILDWLNALPQVKKILAQSFDNRPVNEQNLSDWRQGGYQDWLVNQDILAQAQRLSESQQELQSVAAGQSFTDHLAAVVTYRFGVLLAAPGTEFDEAATQQLKILGRVSQSVVKLRRSDQNAARVKIETERWEIARPTFTAQNDARLKRLQRDALAVPILGPHIAAERVRHMGNNPARRITADLLSQIECCPDPARFQGLEVSPGASEELDRYIQELVKNPPKTRMQAAMEEFEQMERAMEQQEEEKKARRAAAEHPSQEPSQPPPLSKVPNPNPNLPPAPPSKESAAQPAVPHSPPPVSAAAPPESARPINPSQAKSSNSSETPNPPLANTVPNKSETFPMSSQV